VIDTGRLRWRRTAAGDGRLELYKSTMKFDGDLGRGQHGLRSHKELPL
jgi:hypothetical protein